MGDDPIIHSIEQTGYPPWIDADDPRCPVCGEICETVYKDRCGDIVGCDECLRACDALYEDKCFGGGE